VRTVVAAALGVRGVRLGWLFPPLVAAVPVVVVELVV
jgi:hypothetical protein